MKKVFTVFLIVTILCTCVIILMYFSNAKAPEMSIEETVKQLALIGIECEPIRVDEFTKKKMTFFFDPDGLPLEIHE